jgi:phage-related protein
MMTKSKRDPFEDLFWTSVFLIGGTWLLRKVLEQPKDSFGIFGIKYVRWLYPYSDKKGKPEFLNELKQFDNKEVSFIIQNMIIEARTRESLSMPFYKPFTGTIVSGELRAGQFRIFVYRLNKDDLLMLSVFKKKSNVTPKYELQRAENRLQEFLSR